MKKRVCIREAGSFVAGLLIGLSIVLTVFAMMVWDSARWPALWLLPALVALAFALALQSVVVAERRGSQRTWSLTHRLMETTMPLDQPPRSHARFFSTMTGRLSQWAESLVLRMNNIFETLPHGWNAYGGNVERRVSPTGPPVVK